MTTQNEMFPPAFVPFQAPPPPFVKHSETSREAARAIKPDGCELRTKVFNCILNARAYGRTDSEIQAELGMEGSTERPRRRELEMSGRIRKSELTRCTPSGRLATVWIVKP